MSHSKLKTGLAVSLLVGLFAFVLWWTSPERENRRSKTLAIETTAIEPMRSQPADELAPEEEPSPSLPDSDDEPSPISTLDVDQYQLRVIVQDDRGQAIPADIELRGPVGFMTRRFRPDHPAEFRRLPPGSYEVSAASFGRRGRSEAIELSGPVAERELVLALEPAWVLEVRVVDVHGKDSRKELREVNVLMRKEHLWIAATADPPGPRLSFEAFSFETVSRHEDHWKVQVDREPPVTISAVLGTEVLQSRTLTERIEELELVVAVDEVMDHLGSVRAQLIDAVTQRPIPDVATSLSEMANRGSAERSDEQGRVSFRNVIPATWVFQVHGQKSHLRRVVRIEPGQEIDLGQIELSSPRTIRVRLGAGLQMINLVVRPIESPGWPASDSLQGIYQIDAFEGPPAFSGLGPGRYLVTTWEAGLPRRSREVDVTQGDAEIEVSREPATQVTLRPRFARGESRYVALEDFEGRLVYGAYLNAHENETLWLGRHRHRLRVLAAESGRPRLQRWIDVTAEPRTIDIE